jgi:hypothetical protein
METSALGSAWLIDDFGVDLYYPRHFGQFLDVTLEGLMTAVLAIMTLNSRKIELLSDPRQPTKLLASSVATIAMTTRGTVLIWLIAPTLDTSTNVARDAARRTGPKRTEPGEPCARSAPSRERAPGVVDR